MSVAELSESFRREFTPNQARMLAEAIHDSYRDLVKTSDFNELKEIVRNSAVIQEQTGVQIKELAEAQKRTETKVEELAEAQKRTEIAITDLTEEQRKLTASQRQVQQTVEKFLSEMTNCTMEVSHSEKQ